VAIPRVATDGTLFARDAVFRTGQSRWSAKRQHRLNWPDVAWVQVTEARKALAITAANFFRTARDSAEADRCDGNEWQDHHDFR